MTISNFVAYVKQAWKNKPDTSTPLSAERLTHQEEGIKGNSDAIEAIAAAVVSQIVNDPDKIASMAALYAVNQKIGDVANLPNSAADVVTAITQQNSNIILVKKVTVSVSDVKASTRVDVHVEHNLDSNKIIGHCISRVAASPSTELIEFCNFTTSNNIRLYSGRAMSFVTIDVLYFYRN